MESLFLCVPCSSLLLSCVQWMPGSLETPGLSCDGAVQGKATWGNCSEVLGKERERNLLSRKRTVRTAAWFCSWIAAHSALPGMSFPHVGGDGSTQRCWGDTGVDSQSRAQLWAQLGSACEQLPNLPLCSEAWLCLQALTGVLSLIHI